MLLAALSQHPRGLFTDVDGTISALASAPEAAVLLPGVQPLLIEALRIFDVVAAVSGRGARDARRLVGVPALLYAGNHGLERLDPYTRTGAPNTRVKIHPAARAYVGAISRVLDEADQTLSPRFPGLRVERKGVTGTIHVRNTPNPLAAEEAVAAAIQAAASAAGLRVTRGKMVVELRPPVNVDKGTIITELVRDYALAAALYLGDDATDIDAFRALRRLTADGVCQGVAIAVQHPEAPPTLAAEADIVLDGVERVPDFLRWLLAHA
ncbi:MAG: trehalose-phosphatase [Ktedonobacterales bacterium]